MIRISNILAESQKNYIAYNESELSWHPGRTDVPDDCRPVFATHSNAFNGISAKIAYYNKVDGWYKLINNKIKIKMKTPLRWLEALPSDNYIKFKESIQDTEDE